MYPRIYHVFNDCTHWLQGNMRLAIKAHRDWKQVGFPGLASVSCNDQAVRIHTDTHTYSHTIYHTTSTYLGKILVVQLPVLSISTEREGRFSANLKSEGRQQDRDWFPGREPGPLPPYPTPTWIVGTESTRSKYEWSNSLVGLLF